MALQPTIVAQNKEHLRSLMFAAMNAHGPSCSLNHIDVSNVASFRELFANTSFKGDISQWRVAHVVDMSEMFVQCPFNGDISKWDVSRCMYAGHMFSQSQFNGDISQWNWANIKDMQSMFYGSPFDGDISRWAMPSIDAERALRCLVACPTHGGRKNLKLPNNPPCFASKMFGVGVVQKANAHMHDWLQHQPIGRLHWDALLADPKDALATWATPQMRRHLAVYVQLNPDALETPCIGHSDALMDTWLHVHQECNALALPQDVELVF